MKDFPFTTDLKHHVRILEIANNMKKVLPYVFVEDVIEAALEYEGMFDLMELWEEENSEDERQKTIEAMKESLEDIRNGVKIVGHL